MSLDRTDLVTQKGSVSDVSGSDVSVSNLDDMEASLELIAESSGDSSDAIESALNGTNQLSTFDLEAKMLMQRILKEIKITNTYLAEFFGQVITEKDL